MKFLSPPTVSKRFWTPSKSKKKASLRAPAREGEVAGRRDVGFIADKEHWDGREDLLADGFDFPASAPAARYTSTVCVGYVRGGAAPGSG